MAKYNELTGMKLEEHDDSKELNRLTGMEQDVKETDDTNDKQKSDGAKWPSISKRSDDDNEDPEPEPEPVSKSTDENPWPSFAGRTTKSDNVSKGSQQLQKSISMNVPIFVSKADERIVMGIVYEPDEVDAQGDQANSEEIKKAAFYFMEHNPQFKVMHKGKKVNTVILESYIAPTDFTVGNRNVKKGSWIITARINDDKTWKAIKSGKLTGWSMAGSATVE